MIGNIADMGSSPLSGSTRFDGIPSPHAINLTDHPSLKLESNNNNMLYSHSTSMYWEQMASLSNPLHVGNIVRIIDALK
jgi:hypothetical protein